MNKRKLGVVAGLLALTLVAAPGCVSKKLFRNNLEDTDSRVVAVESAVEANQRRLQDMKTATDEKIASLESKTDQAMQLGNQAMGKAQAAETAALGKLLWSITLTDDAVKFPFGRAVLSEESIRALDALAAKVKAMGRQLYLEIEGHTDSTGSEPLNLLLGSNRAGAVRDYLHEKGGIPLHALSTITHGERKPIADNSSSAGRAQNRRVVVRVLE